MAFTALATAAFLGKVSLLWHFQGSCVLIELQQILVSSISFTPFLTSVDVLAKAGVAV
jgi:hypothetical protein